MYYKKSTLSTLVVMSVLLISSCTPVRDIAYFQKLDVQTKKNVKPQKNVDLVYEARIKPKDLLSITVVSSEPEASRMYNLVVPQIAEPTNQNSLFSQPTLQTYLVDNDGNIEFPVFGKIHAAGFTRGEL